LSGDDVFAALHSDQYGSAQHVYGEEGSDTAVFSGDIGDYTISGTVSIYTADDDYASTTRIDVKLTDDTEYRYEYGKLYDIEALQFGDKLYTVNEVFSGDTTTTTNTDNYDASGQSYSVTTSVASIPTDVGIDSAEGGFFAGDKYASSTSTLYGLRGDDVFAALHSDQYGSAQYVYGEEGSDTAVFSGDIGDYTISKTYPVMLIVVAPMASGIRRMMSMRPRHVSM